jgi:hypothetical protein
LNVLPFYQNRLASLLELWFICEELLSLYCGEHRAGNLFCIRAKDGPGIVTTIQEWFRNKGQFGLNNAEGLHYSALNMAALYKFGSVEVRTMRGLTDAESIKTWVRILRKLYDESEKYTDPRTIIEQFSLVGPLEFFHQLFGEYSNVILSKIPNEVNVTASLFEGMRFAQDIAYSRDWSTFNPVKTVVDPFGRSKAKNGRRRGAQVNFTDEETTDMNTANNLTWGHVYINNTLPPGAILHNNTGPQFQ